MTKAFPRSIKGIDRDGQRLARGAAQREGKTLGEWLHRELGEHADHGSRRMARHDAPLERAGEDAGRTLRRPFRDVEADRAGLRDAEPRGGAMAWARSEAPTRAPREMPDDMLASIERMLQTNERRRDHEREAVDDLARKMARLENSLSERLASGENPIKGALARLEARLDIIGKRDAAEAQARSGFADAGEGPRGHVEDKLNAILDALQQRRGEASSAAIGAVQAARPRPTARSLGDAIAQISRRQDTLDAHVAHTNVAHTDGSRAVGAPDPRFGDRDMAREGRRWWEPRRAAPAAADRSGGWTREIADVDTLSKPSSLERDIRSISERMNRLRSGASERPADASDEPGAPTSEDRLFPDPNLTKVEQRLEDLASKVDQALAKSSIRLPGKVDTRVVEDMVRDLGVKIEAVRVSSADTGALEALHGQVELLSSRFERSEQGLSILPTLAASVRELFDQLESTRASVESSATQAAREVLRIAAADGERNRAGATSPAKQPDDERPAPKAPLESVHHMLDEAVDHLSAMDAGRRSPVAPAMSGGRNARFSPAAVSPAAAPVAGGARLRHEATLPVEPAFEQHAPAEDLDEVARRADYIAAARRAAKSARAESLAATGRRPQSPSEAELRAGLVAKSRDYVATHKRPLLMGVAAVLMVLGTIALLAQTGVGGGTKPQVAERVLPQPHTRLASAAAPATTPRQLAVASTDLSPSALPKGTPALSRAIPGSDPIQTGSIPGLPAFAANVGATAPTLPAGLQLAADSGNGAAQYELGVRYAEGRAVPRDLKLAASWLGKAADQGLAPAQYRLASLFEKGSGVAQDKAKAKSLYTQAADAGNPRAMHNLAVLLADGNGVPDYAGAAAWFRKAAAFGVHDSQYNLAILLARGLGVQQNLVQSYQWFAIAAAQGDEDAAHKRDEIATKLGANDLAIAKAFAAAFKPKEAVAEATSVAAPAGGWGGAAGSARINSKAKVSAL